MSNYEKNTNIIFIPNESADIENEFIWDFGDGNTSNDRSPTHKYTQIGTYEITLKVTNSCGSDLKTRNITIVDSVTPIKSSSKDNTSSIILIVAAIGAGILYFNANKDK